jgi:hypothetical protein
MATPTLLGSEIVTKYGDFFNSIFFPKKALFFNLKKANKRKIIPHFIYVFGRSQIRQKKKKKTLT